MSKQRRIKKLVKGHLNSKDASGADVHADKEERLLQLMGKSTANVGSNLTDAQLLAVLLDADNDSASHKDDIAPFDAREQVDTDGDGIGDNRDIIQTKVRLDAIFKTLELGVGEAANGSLQDLLDRLAAAIVDLAACASIVDDDDRAARYALLLAGGAPEDAVIAQNQPAQTSQGSDLTKAGLAALKDLITADAAKAEALKVEIAAMTATDGVTIDEPAPYNVLDAAKASKTDAGNTDVATAIAGVDADVTTAEGHIDTIEAQQRLNCTTNSLIRPILFQSN